MKAVRQCQGGIGGNRRGDVGGDGDGAHDVWCSMSSRKIP